MSEAPRENVHDFLLPLLSRREELERERARIEREMGKAEEKARGVRVDENHDGCLKAH